MPPSRWLFLTVPGFVISAVGLAWTIRGLLRTLHGATVATAPLRAETAFTLPEAGSFEVYLEGRLGSGDFRGLTPRLADAAGRAVVIDPIIFRTHVNSVSRARLALWTFSTPAPGQFTLTLSGLSARADPDDRVLVTRPVRGSMVLYTLGIIACGVLTIGSLVASSLAVVLPGRAGR